MKISAYLRAFWPVYLCCGAVVFALSLIGRSSIQVDGTAQLGNEAYTIVLDAGHGGEDGGAVSCTGVPESQINLQISLRLQALLQLLGYDVVMIRSEDKSVCTEGETIAQRKISDMKNRVRTVNQIPSGMLISIHQNTYPHARYSGAQVFYNHSPDANELARQLQKALVEHLNPGSRRKCRQAKDLYLMDRSRLPAILVECGFLSNPQEEAQLRNPAYQRKLCCVIASSVSLFLHA